MRPECIPQSKHGYAAMPGKKLTEEERLQVLAALDINSNATAVAREIGGVSAAGVWKIAKGAGIELTAGKAAPGCNNRVAPEKRAEIVAALNANPNGGKSGQRPEDLPGGRVPSRPCRAAVWAWCLRTGS